MRQKCIIHIGMHKTGSSSIQESLSKNKDLHHLHYADLITYNHSGKIFSIFSNSSKKLLHLKRRGMSDKDIENFISNAKKLLTENCEKTQCDTMILSGEGIVRLSIDELEAFKLFLENYFHKVIIVAYVRTPISFIHSAFQQQIKEGIDYFNIAESSPNYKKKFEKFDIVFGQQNVQLWKFDPKNFKSNDVVIDFCDRLGIHIDISDVTKSNETISKEALSLLYIYRKYGQGFGVGKHVVRENNLLINALKSLGNTKIKFSQSLIQSVRDKINDDILWMESRLGESLKEDIADTRSNIETEKDLLYIAPSILTVLKELLTDRYIPCGVRGDTLTEIAILVHCLRIKLITEYREKNKVENNIENDLALRGNKGYLFLKGGRHRIIDFFTAQKKPNQLSIDNFSHNIANRSKYCKQYNIEYRHFIFPEKIYALRHLTDLPIKSLYNENYRDYKDINTNINYFEFSPEQAEEYYNKTDTHINLYGNLELLNQIIIEDNIEIIPYKDKVKKNVRLKTDFVGDLGIKLTPPESELIISYKSEDCILSFTNGLHSGNNGKLYIFTNNEAILNKKVLIFGDSFFRSILKHLSHFYSEIVFCRSPFFHKEVVELCSPDIVYTGNAERYLSNVALDESRYDFFAWPLIEDRGLSPDAGFGDAMKRVFNVQKFQDSKIEN